MLGSLAREPLLGLLSVVLIYTIEVASNTSNTGICVIKARPELERYDEDLDLLHKSNKSS
jgi:hypothetical protein